MVGLTSSGFATAALVLAGSGYPAPGGTTATSSGAPIQVGGRTITYGGFNPSAYSALYYALGDYPTATFSAAGPRLYADGSPDLLSFSAGLSNLSSGKVVWTGTSFVPGAGSVGTRFTLQVSDLNGLALSLIDAGALGLPPALGGVLAAPSVGFKANWYFELSNPTSGIYGAAGPTYDAIAFKTPGNILQSSVGGAFYYELPTAVPLPAAMPLLMGGIAAFGAIAHRRRKCSAHLSNA